MKHVATSIALVLLGVVLSNGQVTPACTITKADIVFVLDASGSVTPTHWRQELKFAKEVVKGFDIGPNKVRVALIEFSAGASLQAGFNKYTTLNSLVSGIDKVRKSNGGTRTDKALDLVRTTLLPQKRKNVPLTVIVITDGGSNDKTATLIATGALKATKTTVFAVGVGNYVRAELEQIASNRKFVYTYTDFNKLLQLQQVFKNEACKVVNKLAPTTRKVTTPKPTTNHPSGCNQMPVDLVFAVDTSDSVGLANFNLTKSFLKSLMTTINFGAGNARVGLIKFNDKTKTEWELNQNNNLGQANRAINNMKYDSGDGTVISAALRHMRENSFTAAKGARPNVPNIGILVTDGKAKDAYRTQFEANKTKNANILLFTVGIGGDVDEKELNLIASDPGYFFKVNNFNQLANIRIQLAATLCRGYTLPPTTTPRPKICQDAIDCSGYKENICFENSYRIWAKKNCPAKCDLCPSNTFRYLPPPKPCVDKAKNCAQLIGVCSDPQYKSWMMGNCPSFCKKCKELNPPAITQAPTTPRPTTAATIKRTRKTVATTPAPTTPFTCCDPQCCDKTPQCSAYGSHTCLDPSYKAYMENNCPEFCGVCKPSPQCMKTPPPCADKVDCSKYDDSACFDKKVERFMRDNCNKRCFCGPNPATTAVPSTKCEDLQDCSSFGGDVCSDYEDFSKKNCRATCGYCVTIATSPGPCADKRDCSGYDKASCVNPDYRKFMFNHCRKYCDLCNASN